MLCDIVHLLCQIDRAFPLSNVIDHPIVSNAIRIIQNSINGICTSGVYICMHVYVVALLSADLLTFQPIRFVSLGN